MKSVLLVSIKKNEILIKINEEASYDKIMEILDKKIPILKKLYKGAKNPIRITGKCLKAKEMEEIKNIIKNEIDGEIAVDSLDELIRPIFIKKFKNKYVVFGKSRIRKLCNYFLKCEKKQIEKGFIAT